MKLGISVGTPLIDGLWIGATVACVESNVIAIGMGEAPDDASAWRVFARADVLLHLNVGHVARDDAAKARIIAAWHRKCGRLDGCVCEPADARVALPRPSCRAAAPRLPMPGARARLDA